MMGFWGFGVLGFVLTVVLGVLFVVEVVLTIVCCAVVDSSSSSSEDASVSILLSRPALFKPWQFLSQ